MNKVKKIVPELRFPEFVNDGEWQYLNGDELFKPISNRDHNSDLPILAISQEHGAIPRELIDYTVIATKESIKSYKVVEKGDFIISLRSFQGGIEYSNYKGICSPAYIILRKKKKLEDIYFKYYFKTDLYIRHLNKNLEGIRDGKMVSNKQFSEIPLPYPSYKEQKKIATYLSSLDEVITAHIKKIDALNEHKIGLMQNLFPQEGKKIPNLRFPEFKNAKPWTETALNKLAERIVTKNSESLITTVFTNSATHGIVEQREYFDKDIADKSNLSNYYVVEPGDYVYNPRISNAAPVGPVSKNKLNKPGAMSPLYTVFRFKEKEDSYFEYYFKSNHWFDSIKKVANTGARFDRISITDSILMGIPVLFPESKEQQKIASCLSNLDCLIKEQSDRLNQLREYKKGMIQSLFPKIND